MKKLPILILFVFSPLTLSANTIHCNNCQVVKSGKNSSLQFYGSFRGASFVGRKNLQNATFSGDFTGANFTGCNLTGATMNGVAINANFTRATMRKFTFNDVNAVRSKFFKANLSGAILAGNFSRADLRGTTMIGVNGKNTNFNYANLNYAKVDNTNAENSSFYKASFFRANVTRSVFRNVNMVSSIVTKATFTDNDFSGSNHYGISWGLATMVKGNVYNNVFYEPIKNPPK